jgi:cytochrome c biogenesis protein CcmG, thiol:disulfide interchange protein DsbE
MDDKSVWTVENDNVKKNFPVLFIILLLAVAGWFYRAYKTVPALPFYENNITDESGRSVKTSDFKGRYVLVSYFQTWCGSCIQELVSIDILQMKAGKDKLKVLMISDEEMKKILRFKEKYCNTLDFYQSVESLNDISIRVFPTTYLLDKQGNVLMSKINSYDWSSEEVLELLKK